MAPEHITTLFKQTVELDFDPVHSCFSGIRHSFIPITILVFKGNGLTNNTPILQLHKSLKRPLVFSERMLHLNATLLDISIGCILELCASSIRMSRMNDIVMYKINWLIRKELIMARQKNTNPCPARYNLFTKWKRGIFSIKTRVQYTFLALSQVRLRPMETAENKCH